MRETDPMYAPPATHPTDQTLHAYGLGKLEDISADSVSKHLESCPACRRRVADLSSDSFLDRLRDAQAHPDSPSPDVSSLAGPSMMASGTGTSAPPRAETLPPGLTDHPNYEVLCELGQGGMGVVYLAENKLMGRKEVLKVVSSHLIFRRGVRDRFLAEIRNAAKLHHPNIVTAYSALQLDESLILAMEYVEGLDLAKMVKARGPLPVANASNYVHQAALGLQHAHENGMVHRDIKPGNLMLTPRGQVKILDFGLARLARDTPTDGALTQEGSVMGTPDYIAPEQATDARNADIRADIYSLGCTLYCLLAGRPPFPDGTQVQKILAHIESRPTPITTFRKDVPDGLARIIDKMLAKDPAQRYQSPSAVAEALAPFTQQDGAGSRDRSVPLYRRPWVLIAAAACALALLVTLAGVVMHIRTEHGVVAIESDDPDIEVIVKQGGKAITILNKRTGYQANLRAGEYELELGPDAKGAILKTDRFTLTQTGKTVKVWREQPAAAKVVPIRPAQAKPARIVADWKFGVDAHGRPVRDGQTLGLKSGEAVQLNDGVRNIHRGVVICGANPPIYVSYPIPRDRPGMDGLALRTGPEHGGVFFPPDIDEELSTNEDFSVWMRVKLLSLQPRRQHLLARPDRYALFVWPEGALELSFWSWKDRLIDLFSNHPAARGKHPLLAPLLDQWVDIGFSFDGNGNDKADDTVKVYVNGHAVGTFTGAAKMSYGDFLHLGMDIRGNDRADALFDRVIFYHGILDDEGFRKLSAGTDGKLPPPPPMGSQIGEFVGHNDLTMSLAFSPDSKRLLTGSYDQTLRLWDVATQKAIRVFRDPVDGARGLAFFKDGKRFVVGGDAGQRLRIWEVDKDAPVLEMAPVSGGITGVALSPDEKHILSAAQDVVLWDAATGQQLGRMPIEPGAIWTVAFAPTERLALSGAGDGSPRLWDIDKRTLVRTFGKHDGVVRSAAFLPDGKRALTCSWDGTLRLWEVATGKQLHVFDVHKAWVNQVVVTHDGRFALTAGHDHLVRVWDLQKLELVANFRHFGAVEGVAVSPDGRFAASCARDNTVRLWRMPQP
jgi:hypothetical protein